MLRLERRNDAIPAVEAEPPASMIDTNAASTPVVGILTSLPDLSFTWIEPSDLTSPPTFLGATTVVSPLSLATITCPLSVAPTILSPVFVSTGFSIVGFTSTGFSSSFGFSSLGFSVEGVVVVTSSFLSVEGVVVEVLVLGSTSSFFLSVLSFLSSAGFSSFGCSVVDGVSAVVDS